MKQVIRSLVLMVAAASLLGVAIAANPKCPKCKMVLTTKKDKMHSVAVKIKGKTYYCCAACGAHKKPPMPKPVGKMETASPKKGSG